MMASQGIGDDGTYLINDNGHINQRSQSYVSLNKSQQSEKEPPNSHIGPGTYDYHLKDHIKGGPIFVGKASQKSMNPSDSRNTGNTVRISAPSIPNRYYTPFIEDSNLEE